MPKKISDWYVREFATVDELRREAGKWEAVAKMADEDGDEYQAEYSRAQASLLRQSAREKQVDDFARAEGRSE